jgi:hypothetical protein
MRVNERVTVRCTATALAVAALAACGGGSSGPSNELPKGIKEIGATVYPATTAGTGAWARPPRRPMPTRPAPRRPSCAATRCIPTTAASSTRCPPAATARSTAPTSRPAAR